MEIIEGYFSDRFYKPFFAAVGDADYLEIKDKIEKAGYLKILPLSKFCGTDKKPNIDDFTDALITADVDCNENKFVVLGLGEYLALEGSQKTSAILNRFKDLNIGPARVLFLLRGVTQQIQEMINSDLRIKDRQAYVFENAVSEVNFTFAPIDTGMYQITGFKKILEHLEQGKTEIKANTNLSFPNSSYPIKVMKNTYQVIRSKCCGFTLPEKIGTEEYWDALLNDIKTHGTLDKIFEHYQIIYSENDLYDRVIGSDYLHWLNFIYLQLNKATIKNKYLRKVLNESENMDEFKDKIVTAISQMKHTDSEFDSYYAERKRILKSNVEAFEPAIAAFVSQNREDIEEGIYRLTDLTKFERETIIAEIAQHDFPKSLEKIYPDLAHYLKPYQIVDDKYGNELSEYFEEYKSQKVRNTIDDAFLTKVDNYAKNRIYNYLKTRDSIVAEFGTIDNSFLCWIDALGVEYLSFIFQLAKEKGLKFAVSIGRVNLPTLTEKNKAFFDSWPTNNKIKIDKLDNIKHNENGENYYDSVNSKYAIHLSEELQIISKVIGDAAIKLASHKVSHYVIASDHGASRLAVLRKKEEKYETKTKGEHSGRCCKTFNGYENDLPFATEENGYIVLADYGRFKGSRMANIEVHGGASLEEVLVPVIDLSLKNSSIRIKLDMNNIIADYKEGITLTLFCEEILKKPLNIIFNGKEYLGVQTDQTHYKVTIPDIKKAGEYEIDVAIGKNLVEQFKFKAKGKSATVNKSFDDLF